jgi:glycosyltransferase involved in cell wall biosynthesis
VASLSSQERYSAESVAAAKRQIDEMQGVLEFLPNYTVGDEPKGAWGVPNLGGMENWKVQCAAGASAGLNIASRHDCAFMYCHDSSYSLAPIYATLQANAFQADLVACYVVHATALTHEMPLPNPERLMAESAAVHWAKISPRTKLGKVSEFMAQHLVKDYGAEPKTIIPTGNGVNPTDPYFRQRTPMEIRAKLEEFGVPLDRPLLVSFGRSVPYKRHDLLLKAAAHLKGQVHPVLMTFPHYQELHDLRAALDIEATLVTSFDKELMASLLQWENSVITALLAYNEPCGLIPMEARILSRNGGPILVVSDSGGLVEQVTDGVDGFISKQDDFDDIARVMHKVLQLSPERRKEIRKGGLEKVLEHYTWSSQIIQTLGSCIPHVAAVSEDVRRDMKAFERECLLST